MKEFIIFVCTDSTEIFFSKLCSAAFNLPSNSLTLTVQGGGGSNKHCLFTIFIYSRISSYKITYFIIQLTYGPRSNTCNTFEYDTFY